MRQLLKAFIKDDAGFVVSAELVLVSSVAVLSMVVGLSQVANAINNELNDVANAFGSLNQGFSAQGFQGKNGRSTGSGNNDMTDHGDNSSIVGTAPQGEGGWNN